MDIKSHIKSDIPLYEVYEKVKSLVPLEEWFISAEYIEEINRLKREKGAVILAHNYQTPDIFHGVADIVGDSLALAQKAKESDADIIVLCGVHFMAETAKIVNPSKKVLIPDLEAGCSLASSITAQDVRKLREKYPGVPIVAYVNTTAEVKAEVDICCTSANAVKVVESLGSDRVIFLPDKYLGKWVARQTGVEIILWDGTCEVHEKFTAEELKCMKSQFPDLYTLAHPECAPEVLELADFVGSTSGMIRHLSQVNKRRVALITECSMGDNVMAYHPDKEFIRTCNMCPHMKKITLQKIVLSLKKEQFEVKIDENTASKAREAIERMLKIGRS